MGSLEEKNCKARYSPSDEHLPVEALISIMEHETSAMAADKEKIAVALFLLDLEDIGKKAVDAIHQERTWLGFKAKLIEMFAREQTTKSKANLLKSLVKGVDEDCRHYIIRVRHTADLLKPSCDCSSFLVDNEELVSALFLAGLDDLDRDLFLQSNSSPEEFADLLSGSRAEDSEVKIEELSPGDQFDDPADNFDEIIAPSNEIDIPEDKKPVTIKLTKSPIVKPKKSATKHLFKCPHQGCHHFSRTEQFLKIHLNPHFNEDKDGFYNCSECDFRSMHGAKKTQRRIALKRHVWTVHKKSPEGEAVSAPTSSDPQSLEPDAKGNFLCQQCYFHSDHLKALQRHLDEHKKGKGVFSCEHSCSFNCGSQEMFDNHVSPPHLPIVCGQGYAKCGNQMCGSYKCGRCGQTFGQKGDYATHVRAHLACNRDVRMCQHCAEEFPTEEALTQHLEAIHLVFKKWHPCNVCSFKSECDAKLLVHQRPPHLPEDANGRFSCGDCDFQSTRLEEYQQHVSGHGETANRCPHCAKLLPDRQSLQEHLDDVHLMGGRYKCEFCNYRAPHKHRVDTHVQRIHLQVKNLQCQYCPKKFYSTTNLERHLKSHTADREMFQCVLCLKAFTQKVTLKTHVEKVHKQPLQDFNKVTMQNPLTDWAGGRGNPAGRGNPGGSGQEGKTKISELIEKGTVKLVKIQTGPDPIKEDTVVYNHCNICGQAIDDATKTAYLLHIKTKHEGKRFMCNFCSNIFVSKLYLLDHQMRKHEIALPKGTELYYCQRDECDFKTLIKHHTHFQSSHAENQENHQCQVCGKKFAMKAYVDEHIARTHMKIRNFKCDYPNCKFTSYNLCSLNSHVKKVHEPKPEDVKVYQCQECGHTAKEEIKLRTHIKTVHLKVKEYRCTLCNILFAHRCNLQEHIGLRHMGFKDAKEWRKPENKEARKSATRHEAFEFIPDEEWERSKKRRRIEQVGQF